MRKQPLWVNLTAIGALALLYVPLLGVALFSVNDAKRGFAWKGLTLRWYQEVLDNAQILGATWNTLVLAVVSTAIATGVGTLLALGMDRHPWARRTHEQMDLVVHLPVVTPDIILAAALVVAFRLLSEVWRGFEPGLLNMVLGHVTFQIPFVALVVRSRLATLGAHVEEAGRDLYGDGGYVLRRLRLPLLWPGILAGGLLAFTLSLDDFVISFFTYSPDTQTLPIYIYNELRKGITAATHALSTLIIAATVLLVLGLGLVTTRGRQERPS